MTPVTATVSVTETGSGLARYRVLDRRRDLAGLHRAAHLLCGSEHDALRPRHGHRRAYRATVTAPIKIDRTPPSSKIHFGEYTFGVWQAGVITDTLGNYHLQLAGVIDDEMSGRSGMRHPSG